MREAEHARLQALFDQEKPHLTTAKKLKALGLTIDLKLESPKLLNWLCAYMDPFYREDDPAPERIGFDVEFVYADGIVQYATWMSEAFGADETVSRKPGSQFHMLELGKESYLLVEPVEGTAFLVNWATGRIRAAYSSKTRWPGKTLVSLVIEILTRYLEGIGYCIYHAGAFTTERGAVIVCGKGGSGKTTLLSGAVMAGAELIANERCFIKVDESGVHAVGFPQKVFVGLGMGLSFDGLKRYARNPATLLGPQRRYDRARVARTDPDKIGRLGDKFGMLTAEFTRALNGSKPVVGGNVVGILQPQISSKVERSTLAPLGEKDQKKLMRHNTLSLGRDKHYSYWLDLDLHYATPHHDALSKLPGATMHYRIKNQTFQGMADPLGTIYDTLAAQEKR